MTKKVKKYSGLVVNFSSYKTSSLKMTNTTASQANARVGVSFQILYQSLVVFVEKTRWSQKKPVTHPSFSMQLKIAILQVIFLLRKLYTTSLQSLYGIRPSAQKSYTKSPFLWTKVAAWPLDKQHETDILTKFPLLNQTLWGILFVN